MQARASGALHQFDSERLFIEDGGVEFIVRRALNAQAAPAPKQPSKNPFVDPEPDLVIGDVSPTHYALLNKYNVIDYHLLVVTTRYVDQEVLLDLADFEALSRCMPVDTPLLAFYNGGRGSGGSQPHKHLQILPLPLSPRREIPISPLLESDPPRLPFRHAFARLGTGDLARPATLLDRYRELYAAAGLQRQPRGGVECQSDPYNLLVTRGWMLLVPRSQERFEGIAINSVAFAGSLFVRDERQLQAVERVKPVAILKSVA